MLLKYGRMDRNSFAPSALAAAIALITCVGPLRSVSRPA
jgi:hypothetical protein